MPQTGLQDASEPVPPVLWTPSTRRVSHLQHFLSMCQARAGREFGGYDDLWEWSVTDGLEEMWAAVWHYFRVDATYERVLDSEAMPGATWFPGALLNYADHALRHGDAHPEQVAIIGVSDARARAELTWGQLGDQVTAVRGWLREVGVGRGDRVAGYVPNVPEAIVAFLATASLGAIWTSCAPEFGVTAVLDRFGQVAPKVLFAVDGYRYGDKQVARVDELIEIRAGLPSLEHVVVLEYPSIDAATTGVVAWRDVVERPADRKHPFERVPGDHPLYVLYSSGTTGLPKPIVHGHGGILVEHLKVLGLHCDLDDGDRLLWFTTTGWMMWNFIVSGLLLGATVVTFDGDPSGLDGDRLWKLAADEQVTHFGVGAPFITAAARAGRRPRDTFDLSGLRMVGSTGAPLPPDGFDWVYEAVSEAAMLSPISGGTDVCSAFVGGSPLTPVWRGEIPCRYLGASVEAFDEAGRPVIGEQGELVITRPMPSMPVGFWGDADGERYRDAYFGYFPGVWRHGDWVTVTDRGSCIITGRSDATLNRGGVRVGTAEIYRVVESIPGVVDSLVVHLEDSAGDGPGQLVLFVRLASDGELDDDLRQLIASEVRTRCSPRHVPDEIYEVEVVPTTLSGKKLEIPVKRILLGADPGEVASRGSLQDPLALDGIVEVAAQRGRR